MVKKETLKAQFAFVVLCLLFIAALAKAFIVQVIDKKELQARYEKQFFRVSTVYPNRGNIYDRNGSPLAINVQTYSIFTIPQNMSDQQNGYRELSEIVPELSLNTILRKVHKRRKYTFLARKISLSDDQVEKIKNLGSQYGGIYLEAVPKRIYPNNELLAQVLGFVGIDNGGLAGLEYQFDKELRGEGHITKYIQDAKGRAIKFQTQEVNRSAQNIYLSIDKELQAIAEKSLKDAVNEYHATKGGIGVMDAATGEILAVANYPTFDPNNFKSSKSEHRKLAFVSDPFEPGSIFKVLTAASALENKIVTPDTNYYCEKGKFQVGKYIINEAEADKGHEWLSVKEIIKYSSNIGTTKMAFDLTYPRLKETLKKFNIGEKTGIEIPGESRGIVAMEDNVPPISLSNISFGQGIATTAIQILAAYAAIINEGVYVRPTILRGQEVEKTRIIPKAIANSLVEMMVDVVENGTGTNAQIPYFTIAGKTSTAQRPDNRGGYSGYIPGFVGFPVNVNDKFLVYVYLDNVKTKKYYGNTVAAPVFKQVAQYFLYREKDFQKLAEHKMSEKFFDSVNVKRAAVRVVNAQTVPNFSGLDKKSVNELIEKYSFNIVEKGFGIVYQQSPAAGSPCSSETIIKLIYRPPQYE